MSLRLCWLKMYSIPSHEHSVFAALSFFFFVPSSSSKSYENTNKLGNVANVLVIFNNIYSVKFIHALALNQMIKKTKMWMKARNKINSIKLNATMFRAQSACRQNIPNWMFLVLCVLRIIFRFVFLLFSMFAQSLVKFKMRTPNNVRCYETDSPFVCPCASHRK